MNDELAHEARANQPPQSTMLSETQPRLAVTAKRPALKKLNWRDAPRSLLWPDGAGRWSARWNSPLLALTTLVSLLIFAPMRPGVGAYLQAAAQARAVSRYDLALANDALAHHADASDPRPLCDAGDVYTLQQLPRSAVNSYRECAMLAPDDGSAWLRLGDTLASAGDDAGSVSAWKQAGQTHDYDGYIRLAERAESLGLFAEASRWWSQVPQDTEIAEGHLGLLALAQGNATAASAHFYPLAHSQSDYAIALRNAGVYLMSGYAPRSARDFENIGYALLTLGEPAVALAPLRQSARLAPTDGSARAYYGWTLWLLGQRVEARPEIAAGLRYAPGLPFARYAAGAEALADGKAAAALSQFQAGLALDSKNVALWSAAGDAALAASDYTVALLSYQNAAQLSNDPLYTEVVARFNLDHGLGLDDGSALRYIFAGLQRFPHDETLVTLEGRIYDRLGQQDLAAYAFQHALALNQTDPAPWYYLGSYAASTGDAIPAVVMLRTAIALRPAGPYAALASAALTKLDAHSL